MSSPLNTNIDKAFRDALSRHGYSYQYAVYEQATSLYQKGLSPWLPLVPEFPVANQGSNSRIDILFYYKERNIYLIGECKRVNPSLANWCFAKAPWPTESGLAEQNYIETIYSDNDGVTYDVSGMVNSSKMYQIALEVRTNLLGDSTGSVRGDIEDASTQVLRGFNGLIEFLGGKKNRELVNVGERISFIPAIFTTANIYATDAEVTSPNIIDGNAGDLNPALSERDWIWYEYPQSPNLKHSILNKHSTPNLRELVYRDYVRRIAIVNSKGIGNFLGSIRNHL